MSNHPDSLKYEDVPWGEIAQHEASAIKILHMSDIQKCPTLIFLPSHYRDDGSCRHNEPNCEVDGCSALKFEEEIFCERHVNEMEGAPCEYENGWCVSHTPQYHDRGEDCEHEFENTYPMRECLLCGLVEDSPEPIYDDEG